MLITAPKLGIIIIDRAGAVAAMVETHIASALSGRNHDFMERDAWPLYRRLQAALLDRARSWLGIRIFVIFKRPHSPACDSLPAGYDFHVLTADEYLDLAEISGLDVSAEFIAGARQRGDVCAGVTFGGDLVAYGWYSFSRIVPCDGGLGFRHDMPSDVYGYKAYTKPAHRGMGLQSRMKPACDTFLDEKNITHTVGYIEAQNHASLQSLAKMRDAMILGWSTTVRIFGVNFVFNPSAVRRNGIAMVATAPAAPSLAAELSRTARFRASGILGDSQGQ